MQPSTDNDSGKGTTLFNLNNFMSELKAIDLNCNFNQAYITRERENLLVKTSQLPVPDNASSGYGKSGSYTQS